MKPDVGFLRTLTPAEPLDRKKHDRAAFSCGEDRLDRYLKEQAAKLADTDQVRTYVVCERDSPVVVGYFGVCTHKILLESLPEDVRSKLAKYPEVSAILLSMIATASPHQGKGVGTYMLGEVLKLSFRVADQIGARFLILDAINEKAARLYRAFGFVDLPAIPGRMILDLNTARKAREKADQKAATIAKATP